MIPKLGPLLLSTWNQSLGSDGCAEGLAFSAMRIKGNCIGTLAHAVILWGVLAREEF